MRMWNTWKLKTCQDGEGKTTWDRMSKHDQDFNIAWNELRGICHETTLPKLQRMVAAAKLIAKG